VNAAHYLSQLQALLPPGVALSVGADGVLTDLLRALADELARVDGRGEVLIAEADPRTTSELLADWERVAGLPDPCTGPLATLQERRAALVVKLTATGGASPAYFVAVAAAIGYAITITERPEGPNTWRVNAPAVTVTTFKAGQNAAGDPLAWWGDELLECVIRRLNPAHLRVIFSYGGV
jgi:uncharacterized protein YmfQ (DUF2313 family)